MRGAARPGRPGRRRRHRRHGRHRPVRDGHRCGRRRPVVAEALDVSWNFSRYRTGGCDSDAELTGLFPLTAGTAAKFGAPDRCDAQAEIRAAARAVLAGEEVPVASRPDATGPYAPMIGGWSAMPWALGGDAGTIARRGPFTDWSPSAACDAAIGTWLAAAVAAGVPAHGDPSSALAAARGNPRTAPACQSPSARAFDERAGLLAAASAGSEDPTDGSPTGEELDRVREQAPLPDALTAPLADDPAGDDTLAPAPAYSRLATYLGGRAADLAPGGAEPGTDAVVARLAPTSKTIASGGRSAGLGTSVTFPTADASVDYAVYYGGIRPQWATFGTKVGVVGQVVGDGGAGFALGGDASVVIAAAKKWLGTPYSWGGGGADGPSRGTPGREHRRVRLLGPDRVRLRAGRVQDRGYTVPQESAGVAVSGGIEAAQPGDLSSGAPPATTSRSTSAGARSSTPPTPATS